MKLKDAVKHLISSYGDIRAEAKTYQFDESEVLKAMEECKDDTAEKVVLTLLLESALKKPAK